MRQGYVAVLIDVAVIPRLFLFAVDEDNGAVFRAGNLNISQCELMRASLDRKSVV